jgi:hypothetical protein
VNDNCFQWRAYVGRGGTLFFNSFDHLIRTRKQRELERILTIRWSRRALGDDVDDLERHHYFAGLVDCLDERGDCAAIGL